MEQDDFYDEDIYDEDIYDDNDAEIGHDAEDWIYETGVMCDTCRDIGSCMGDDDCPMGW